MNRTTYLEIRGSSRVSFGELNSDGPFYILSPRLTGVGCVTILPDNKQGKSPHL